jgi:ligand-binding SRPBCC domain-containing protein
VQFVKESTIRASAERVFVFHRLPDVLERLLPPWEKVKIVARADISVVGSRAEFETRIFGLFAKRWVAEHTVFDPPRLFEDVQVSGPFRYWRHRHLVRSCEDGAILRDEIEYEPPLGPLGRLAAPLIIAPKLKRLFDFRHQVTKDWCEKSK